MIKCKNPRCKEYYHIPCAIQKGMIFDLNYMKKFYNVSNNEEIPFYCSNHNKKISFIYKTYVMNDCNGVNCRKNLIQDDFHIYDNEEKKPFPVFDQIGDQFLQNNPTLFGCDDEKIKSSRLRTINSVLSITEGKKENSEIEKENGPEIDNNMEVDDSFENQNNPFKLDIETILNEEKNKNERCQQDDIFCGDETQISLSRLNSNFYGSNNDNGLISRQNSFNII